MSELHFTLPGRETPGYLRRMREALRFQELMTATPSIETVDAMVDFLLNFVDEPKDKNEARELLLDASEQQFMELLTAITGDREEENPM